MEKSQKYTSKQIWHFKIEYLIHTEWDSVEIAQLGFAKVLVNTRIRKIHDDGVMANIMRGPYIMFFQPTMEEPGWRAKLS